MTFPLWQPLRWRSSRRLSMQTHPWGSVRCNFDGMRGEKSQGSFYSKVGIFGLISDSSSTFQVVEGLAVALRKVGKLAVFYGRAITAAVDGVHHGERATDAEDEAEEYREHRRPENRHADRSLQGGYTDRTVKPVPACLSENS